MPDTGTHDTDEVALRRREATARHTRHVNALLDRKPELHGVVRLADLIHDAARWAA
jgi:hypothetical protein